MCGYFCSAKYLFLYFKLFLTRNVNEDRCGIFFNTRQLSETKKNILLILSKPNVELLIKMCYLLANLIALLEHLTYFPVIKN